MILHARLFRSSARDGLWLWLSCFVCLFAFAWIHVIVNSRVDMGRFATILENIPDAWESLAPVPFRQLISYPARLSMVYEEPLVYLLMTVWCVSRGSDTISGELGRGTMEMLLAQPISRLQVLLTPTLVTTLGVALLVLAVWAGTSAGVLTCWVDRPNEDGWTIPFTGIRFALGADDQQARVPLTTFASPRMFLPAAANYLCLGYFLTGACTLLSSLDRYRWRTIGIMIGFYVVQMIFEKLGQAVAWLHWLCWLTFFRAYEPVPFVSKSAETPGFAWHWWETTGAGQIVDLGPLTCNAILMGLGSLSLIASAVIFCRRDLPAPL